MVALYPGGAFYPRAAELPDRSLLATFDHSIYGGNAIGSVRSEDGGRTWNNYHPITEDHGRVDLANGFPLVLSNGILLAAYRHHQPSRKVYRLELSVSEDSGRNWRFQGTVTAGSTGLWEPFLFQPSPDLLQVYYASEEDIFPDQRIEMRSSRDQGKTWGPPVTVANKTGSRDGMPAVVRTTGGDLLACFEASDQAPFGFVIRSVRSPDDGATWSTERSLVYQPRNPVAARWSAGAPCLAALPDGKLAVSFQTDEEVAYRKGDAGCDPGRAGYRYIQHTTLKAVVSRDQGHTWGPPIQLAGGPEDPATWGGICVRQNGRVLPLVNLRFRAWALLDTPLSR